MHDEAICLANGVQWNEWNNEYLVPTRCCALIGHEISSVIDPPRSHVECPRLNRQGRSGESKDTSEATVLDVMGLMQHENKKNDGPSKEHARDFATIS